MTEAITPTPPGDLPASLNPQAATKSNLTPAQQARLRVLAATEARLGPVSPSAPARPSPPLSKTNAGRAAAYRAAQFTLPTEHEDREKRLEFGRLLDRGIVRDNSYKVTADAVEVSSSACIRRCLFADEDPPQPF
jgi:hypothetical protein